MDNNMPSEILNEILLKNGKKLILRKATVNDAEEMIKYLNLVGGESDNLLFGKDEFRLTLEQERAYLENVSRDPNTIMVLGLIDDKIVSVAQVSGSSRKRIAHNCDLSISVKKDYWGVGIGSAVMEELVRFAREHGTIINVSLGVKASNHNAMKLYEKFGFKKVGVHKNFFNINGVFDDEILMDLNLK